MKIMAQTVPVIEQAAPTFEQLLTAKCRFSFAHAKAILAFIFASRTEDRPGLWKQLLKKFNPNTGDYVVDANVDDLLSELKWTDEVSERVQSFLNTVKTTRPTLDGIVSLLRDALLEFDHNKPCTPEGTEKKSIFLACVLNSELVPYFEPAKYEVLTNATARHYLPEELRTKQTISFVTLEPNPYRLAAGVFELLDGETDVRKKLVLLATALSVSHKTGHEHGEAQVHHGMALLGAMLDLALTGPAERPRKPKKTRNAKKRR